MDSGDDGANNFPLHAYCCLPLIRNWHVSTIPECLSLANIITANNPVEIMTRRRTYGSIMKLNVKRGI
jgi:hypothetical protein